MLAWVVALAGCGADAPSAAPEHAPARVVAIEGLWQETVVGARVAAPLAVRVQGRSGAPVAGVIVRYAVTRGDGAISDQEVRTGADGVARTELRVLGSPGDTVHVVATAGGLRSAVFRIVLQPAPAVRGIDAESIRGGDELTIRGVALHSAASPAEVLFDGLVAQILVATDSLLRVRVPPCLTGDEVWVMVRRGGGRSLPRPVPHHPSVSPLALEPFGYATVEAGGDAACLLLPGEAAEYLVVAQFDAGTEQVRDVPVRLSVGSGAQNIGSTTPSSMVSGAPPRVRFEHTLRTREAQVDVSARMRAAQRAPAAVPAVGATRRFPVIATIDASRFDTVTTALRYRGERVLVWLDTAAVISDEWMQPVGRWLDGELYDVGVQHFGTPSDVDGDGRVHVVLTPVVNGLTPANQCSLSGFVAGFFTAHDLFASAPNAAGADVVYGHVPDPAGQWGCPHTLYYWGRNLPLAFVHELQHLINFNEKVLLRRGREEAVWLNEGLSHLAEELVSVVHERRYPPPSGRETAAQLFPDSAGWFVLNNMINGFLYLREPYKHSLSAVSGGGTLEERGAGWLFARWLADRFGPDIPRRLVQSPLRGAVNVSDRVGIPFSQLAAEFALMGFVDSLPGVPRLRVPTALRLQSRNLRQLFARLNVIIGVPAFPVELAELRAGQHVSGSLRGGGAVYARVTSEPGDPVTVRFAPADGGRWASTDRPRLTLFRLP